MKGYSGDWVLLNVLRGSAQELAQQLHSVGIGAFVPKLKPSDRISGSEDMFPGYILAEAIVEEKQCDPNAQIEWSVVTNSADRAFAIPGPVVNGLRGQVGSAIHQVQTRLCELAPEYRVEQLMIECTRWRGEAQGQL